ncbi:hypothetical protein R3I93_014772 [Phoxinus phoxinus]|uniref:Lymphocyte cytosolic protein 2 n=1 Tax=Phoxinus phoxinus TaxID=58324 RepID=A0AAN9CNI7_9TELE
MSFDGIPSKSEVLSWDSQRLADFLKKRNLTGCDKVIIRYNISGQRFLSMTENDLQKFPKLHAPLISKICQEINKEKKRFFPPIPAIRPSQPVPSFPQPPVDQYEEQAWDPEEFDSEDDYEDPNEEIRSEGDASGGDYESPEDGSDSDNGYEPPPSEPKEDAAQICPAKPMENSDYIDNNRTRGVSRIHPPMPPERPGPGPSLPHPERPSVGHHLREERPLKRPPAPAVDRSKKPGTLDRSQPPPVAGGRGTSSLDRQAVQPPRGITAAPLRLPPVELPGDPMRIPKPLLPPSGVRRSASSVTPGYTQNRHLDHRNEFHDDTARHSSNTFPLHARNPSPRPPGTHGQPFQTDNVTPSRSLPAKLQEAMNDHWKSGRAPPPPQTDMQDMDPAWYVGQITRGQAESYLRKVNRDGTFLVRDSSNRSSDQPYTLVVLYQEKVYNIQIRRSQNGFMLGTGMKSSEQTFERVGGIINQHKHTPLLLIDAKNRVSSQQNQCALIFPAGH